MSTTSTLAAISFAAIFAAGQTNPASQQREERLAKHAQLFGAYNTGRRFENTKPNPSGVIDLSVKMRNDYFAPRGIATPDDELRQAASLADAIVQGTAVRQDSALTARHSFVFSDWTVKVTRAFKALPSVPAAVGQEIIVTRPGGDTVINGQRVTAHDESFPDFVLGHQYVLYLHALPDSSSFQVMPCAVFDVSGPSPLPLLDPDWKSTTLRAFSAPVPVADLLAAVERSTAQ